MITFIEQKRPHSFFKVVSSFVVLTFVCSVIMPPQWARAQMVPETLLNLPTPGTMLSLTDQYVPAMIKGITIDPQNPLHFNFIVDKGQEQLEGAQITEEGTKLIKYFLASLTVPDKEMWVNLSPYEEGRIISNGLGETEMGRDLLAQDYLLKQLSSSLLYPEKELGKEFWQKIYNQAFEKYNTTDIPVDTFNKVWIVPDQATVYEHGTSAFVVERHLKVMLEEDYLAMMKSPYPVEGKKNSAIVTKIIREIIIPAIEKEINEGENFANLRQIYNSMILATWFKRSLKESLLGKVYVDQNKVMGVDVKDKEIKNKIYNQYLAAFKKGVYNYIREDYDPATQEIIPRKYFSGGLLGIPKGTFKALPEGTILTAAQRAEAPQGVNEVSLDVNLLEEDGSGKNTKVVTAAVEKAKKEGEDFAMATVVERNKLPQVVLNNIDQGVVNTDNNLQAIQTLIDIGEVNLLSSWDAPGRNDEAKKAFLDQINDLNKNYPGGLKAYKNKVKKLLAASKRGDNPFKGNVAKKQLDKIGLDSSDVFQKLIENGWAEEKDSKNVQLTLKFDYRIIAKKQLDKIGLDSTDIFRKLIENDWARKKKSDEIFLTIGLDSRIVEKEQFDKSGLDSKDVSIKLISNGWGKEKDLGRIEVTVDLNKEKDLMQEVFGKDFSKVLPVLQRAPKVVNLMANVFGKDFLEILPVLQRGPKVLDLMQEVFGKDFSRILPILEDALEGYKPHIASGTDLEGKMDEYIKLSNDGIKYANKMAVVLVAGGVGDRLGFNGIKAGIPLSILNEVPYLGLYAKTILAMQKESNKINGEDRKIPFVIMTSADTHDKTIQLLKEKNNFGLDGLSVNPSKEDVVAGNVKQIIILQQGMVPAVSNNNADFILKEDDVYSLQVKPHGHGDIHVLIHDAGLAEYWNKIGVEQSVFIQDTNGQVVNGILPGLAVSEEKDFDLNFLTVSRDAGEAAGSIVDMKQGDQTITMNVEYNELDPLLKSIGKPGDVADPVTGKSPYRANLNVFIVKNSTYEQKLNETGGVFGEFINPKYDPSDPTREKFLKPTRSETMMQDYAKFLTQGEKVGFTNFDKRDVFSPVKNSIAGAQGKVKSNNYPDSMATGEGDYYKFGRKVLSDAGVKINVEGAIAVSQGVSYDGGAKVILSPEFAVNVNEAKEKIKGGSVSDRSVLIVNGENVKLENVNIDGTLIINVVEGASLTVSNLDVSNEGWEFVNLSDKEMNDPNVPESLKIRGYKLVKSGQKVINITKPGKWKVGADGKVDYAMAVDQREKINNLLYRRGYSEADVQGKEIIINTPQLYRMLLEAKEFISPDLNPHSMIQLIRDAGFIVHEPQSVDYAMTTVTVSAHTLEAYDSLLTSTIEAHTSPVVMAKTAENIMRFSKDFNYLNLDGTAEAKKAWENVLVKKSKFARDIALAWTKATPKNTPEYKTFIDQLLKQGFADIEAFGDSVIKSGRMSERSVRDSIAMARRLLPEWLDEKNNVPEFIRAGIIRGLLEGRSEDILFNFGKGWRMFGTAGIRNPAIQSSFGVIADLELSEFAGTEQGIVGHEAPTLTGPNLMNVMTIIQQEQAIVNVYRDIQKAIADGTIEDMIKAKGLDRDFVNDVKNNKVSIAYDSRLNGKYFAHMLAAAFLEHGLRVDLFDRPAGVPPLVYQASENPEDRSAIAILISASHSEANYNGFKAFLSVQRAQVDKAGKNIIVEQRVKIVGDEKDSNKTVIPYAMATEMGTKSLSDFDAVFANYSQDSSDKSKARLKWFGKQDFNPETERSNAEFDNDFYNRFYAHIRELSPAQILGLTEEEAAKVQLSREELNIFYTAFSGCGAVNAQDFPGFLRSVGYSQLTFNDNQTLKHDGRFAGFNKPGGLFGMPDPGVTAGWIVNFVELFQQEAGQMMDLDKLEAAINLMNRFNIGLATDPDIDRAGIDVPLEAGMKGGNIKAELVKAVEAKLIELGADQGHIQAVVSLLKERLHDHLLLTANDAWTFIVFHKLRMMHERGKLDKNKLYIIEKSHVTTDALEFVAKYFRDNFGYNIYAYDTYVGYTELAKKSRDLTKLARISWLINRHLNELQTDEVVKSRTRKDTLASLLDEMKTLNAVLKGNVMYQRRGIKYIDETIDLLEQSITGKYTNLKVVMDRLSVIAHMEIPMGVEESNGYGEFGVFLPNEKLAPSAISTNWESADVGRKSKEHISEKDGSLAAYEFAELLAIGKALENKTPFQMYLDVFKAIGAVATDNRFIQYKGLTGDEKKLDTMRWFESSFGVLLKKALDMGEDVILFNGKYKVLDVQTYRDAKYDNFWIGFPEEGVRLILEKLDDGSKMFTTYRPSGTGANNRDYNWIFGAMEYKGKKLAEMNYEELNQYRANIVANLNDMAMEFFGEQNRLEGYAVLDKKHFVGLLSAIGEVNKSQFAEIMKKVVDQAEQSQFTPAENQLRETAQEFAADLVQYVDLKTGSIDTIDRKLEKLQAHNRAAWEEFLTKMEEPLRAYSSKKWVNLYVDGGLQASLPEAYVMGWQTSAVDYFAGVLEKVKQASGASLNISSNSLEVAELIARRYSKQIGEITVERVSAGQEDSAMVTLATANTRAELIEAVSDSLKVTDAEVVVKDEKVFFSETMRILIAEMNYGKNQSVRTAARQLINGAGINLGVSQETLDEFFSTKGDMTVSPSETVEEWRDVLASTDYQDIVFSREAVQETYTAMKAIVQARGAFRPGDIVHEIVKGAMTGAQLVSWSKRVESLLKADDSLRELGNGTYTFKEYGGINLDPTLLDLQIKRDGNGVPLPMSDQVIENMKIEGFIPVIIHVTPITNLPLMLGFADGQNPFASNDTEKQEKKSAQGLSLHSSRDPLDFKAEGV